MYKRQGINIANTIANVFNVVFLSLGTAVGIIIGQLLGAGKLEEAKDEDNKLIAFAVVCCMAVGIVMFLIAPLFPKIYKTEEEVRRLATQFIQISALCMPLYGFTNAAYFTLRSGGKTMVTFLFDSVFVWLVSIPLVYVLTRYTGVPIVPVYLACQLTEGLKCAIGFVLVKKGVWVQKVV